MICFEIKWKTTKFIIELTEEEFEKTTVLDLKLKCQTFTEIEPEYMKLLAYGAILKKNEEYLKAYGIKSGSKLMLMGSKKHPPLNPDSPVTIKLHQIRNLRESVLRPDIKRYEKQTEEHLKIPQHEVKQTKELINYGNYIHEQLMHMLHQLDTMPEVTEIERVERKNNVIETEKLLNLIDSIKDKLSQLKNIQ